jgi:hypothetical protein
MRQLNKQISFREGNATTKSTNSFPGIEWESRKTLPVGHRCIRRQTWSLEKKESFDSS